ncbi:hypothetical protein BX616_004375 [Lobosporangium transversale]|nr:hypothetical protein BX616_004375 [Lobosporangium transversale]
MGKDVLLKLNLLIRKISDYEIRFGIQYEQFREKIKFLRTKDDTLCEMGRLQTDLQSKLKEASKSKLRNAKAMLLQKEQEESKIKSEITTNQLQQLKRKMIKDAYTDQLNAIIELGKKMQIIGEHGKQLLDHIDLDGVKEPYNEGNETEDILQAARIALENWNLLLTDTVANPPLPAVLLSGAFADSSNNDRKAKASVAVTTDAPPLPPRSPSVPGTPERERENINAEQSEEERLRHLEEQAIKQALEFSLATTTSKVVQGKDIDDLNLTAEELRFIMDSTTPEKTASIIKHQGGSAADNSAKAGKENELIAAKAAGVPKVIRNSQSVETESRAQSQQGPRPWVSMRKPKKGEEVPVEELGNPSRVPETMGDSQAETPLSKKPVKPSEHTKVMESLGREEEQPLEGTVNGPTAVPESMGYDEAPYEPVSQVPALDKSWRQEIQTNQQQQQQQHELLSPFPLSPELQYLQVSSPQMPHQFSPQGSSGTLRVSNSPPSSGSAMINNFQSPTPYQPTTKYIPNANKQKNRLSGTTLSDQYEGAQQSQLADQKAYQLAHQQSYKDWNDRLQKLQRQQEHQEQNKHHYDTSHSRASSKSSQHLSEQRQHQRNLMLQQQQQLQEFYYTPNEQEYQKQQIKQFQQQNPGAAPPQHTAWNWSYPVFNADADYRYKEEIYYNNDGSSPTPSHISLIPTNSAPSTPTNEYAYKVEL